MNTGVLLVEHLLNICSESLCVRRLNIGTFKKICYDNIGKVPNKGRNFDTQTFRKAKEKYRGVFEIQKSGDKTSSGEIGLDIRTHASPKVGQDQVSGGVSVPCRHATPVANALWKPIFSNYVRVGKGQIRERRHKLVKCMIECQCLNKRTFANPKWDRTRCPEE